MEPRCNVHRNEIVIVDHLHQNKQVAVTLKNTDHVPLCDKDALWQAGGARTTNYQRDLVRDLNLFLGVAFHIEAVLRKFRNKIVIDHSSIGPLLTKNHHLFYESQLLADCQSPFGSERRSKHEFWLRQT